MRNPNANRARLRQGFSGSAVASRRRKPPIARVWYSSSRLTGGVTRNGRRPAARNGGVDGAQSAVARTNAWMGHRAAARSDVRGGVQASPWVALPRAPADAAQGFHKVGVADDGEQPSGALLRDDSRRPAATGIRDSILAARVRGAE